MINNTPIIAVTGGKGGTGKSFVATNLAVHLSQHGKRVLLVDCDVENPNTNILLGISLNGETGTVIKKPINIFYPSFNPDVCTKCGFCSTACYRHAILQFSDNIPSVMENMCSGCEVCKRVCPVGAIEDSTREIGHQYFCNQTPYDNLDILIGELNPIEAVSVLIIKELCEYIDSITKENSYDIIVIDTSPGAHCDVEESLSTADLIFCVTEPTPFGEHDLLRILELMNIINKKGYIILNRANMTSYREPIYNMAKKNNASIIGEIDLDTHIIEDYAQGIPLFMDSRDFPAKTQFNSIYTKVKELVEAIKK